ncbi:MAG: hypothetical protein Q9182_007159 [Xanthomendoza sp. 2 TL-2023]
MPSIERSLDGILHTLQTLRPMVPTYLHLLVSALVPIYAGAHASLTRPSSAAKPEKSKKKKTLHGNDIEGEPEAEVESQIEGLNASDAIWFPLLAGCTLGGLYLIIKWLEDPALLNTILNWYFAVFGLVGVAKMFKDSLDVLVSYIFPSRYFYGGQIWRFDEVKKVAVSQTDPAIARQSPLPGRLQLLPLPNPVVRLLWTFRSSQSTLCIRTNLRRRGKIHIHLPPTTIFSVFLALAIVLYYNLVARPWYLTNILGFAFAYNALQLISPSTFWTGNLILGSLFCYDIYFVFFTPLMVTVATKLDIPAKLLFPRPSSPNSTGPQQSQLAMLGLGDVVLPGMMIGFALRLDLYLHYLRLQTTKPAPNTNSTSKLSNEDLKPSPSTNISTSSTAPTQSPSPPTTNNSPNFPQTPLPPYHPATGSWGPRFWLSSSPHPDPSIQGTLFPKPYFHASMTGYIIGMLTTLTIMQITSHAQPALFYLVPCVLGAIWGCAVLKGEVREVWSFDEREGEEAQKAGAGKGDGEGKEAQKVDAGKGDGEGKGVKSGEGTRSARGKKGAEGYFFDLRIGVTRAKGTVGCALLSKGSKKVQSRGRIRKRDHVGGIPSGLGFGDGDGVGDDEVEGLEG